MNEKEKAEGFHHGDPPELPDAAQKKPYEAPSWEVEQAEVNAISCARQPGNPGCISGPTTA
jgi:hypothetical protein